MKFRNKRLVALFCSFALLLSNIVVSRAYTTNSISKDYLEAEIQRRVKVEMEGITKQLAEQDALSHLFIYEELVTEDVRAAVYQEYGIIDIKPYGSGDEVSSPPNMNVPDGGMAHYYMVDGEVEVTVLLLDPERTYDYYLQVRPMEVIMTDMFGYIPYFGQFLSLAVDMTNNLAWKSVEECDKYSKITSTVTENPNLAPSSTVFWGWDTHPYYQIPSSATKWMYYVAEPYYG